MCALLIEIRGEKKPLFTQLDDEKFVEGIDSETEIMLRSNGIIFEIYNPGKKMWEQVPKINGLG